VISFRSVSNNGASIPKEQQKERNGDLFQFVFVAYPSFSSANRWPIVQQSTMTMSGIQKAAIMAFILTETSFPTLLSSSLLAGHPT
jgi:hypothetical protein